MAAGAEASQRKRGRATADDAPRVSQDPSALRRRVVERLASSLEGALAEAGPAADAAALAVEIEAALHVALGEGARHSRT